MTYRYTLTYRAYYANIPRYGPPGISRQIALLAVKVFAFGEAFGIPHGSVTAASGACGMRSRRRFAAGANRTPVRQNRKLKLVGPPGIEPGLYAPSPPH